MPELAQLKIGLDKSGKKFHCPQCRQKRFVRMFDFEANEYLPEEVGRCDRESSCGYHLTAKQYFESKGLGYKPEINEVEIKPEVVDYMQMDIVRQSMKDYTKSNFGLWLSFLFGEDITAAVLSKYFVGRSKSDNNRANIYWRIDQEQKVRTGKIMCYNPETGKRNKDAFTTWVHSQKKANGEFVFPQPYNYKLCFFGEHLLNEDPGKTVCITESEKAAIVASIFMPDMVWLATGGNSGCKWREWSVFNVLKDRKVILFPDFGYFNKKTERTCYQEWKDRADKIMERMHCSIQVNRLLEDSLTTDDRINDFDLVDFLIKRKDGKGLCLTDNEYPALIDIYPTFFNHSITDFPNLINAIKC